MKAILAGALLGLALAGCGGGSRHARPHTAASRPQAKTAVTQHPSAAVIALDAALSAQLKAAGRSSGAIVYDLTAGRQLSSLRPTVGRPPASVEKLYTTVAVLSELGPDARLKTAVLGTGQLAGGVWKGDLYLRGGGDPTFGDGTFNRIWEDGYGPTALQLSEQLRRIGISRVSGRVIGDASLFDARPGAPNTGYAPDVPDIGGELAALTYDHGAASRRLTPGAFAAKELVLTMRSAGIHARPARFTARTPAGARLLASVDSPPMSVLLKLMDVPSDDFFAEMLTKQLGTRFGSAGTTVAGAAVIRSVVAGLGVEPAIVDGSGLSRQDRSSPEQVAELLREVWRTRLGQVLRASLPVVGVNGSARGIAVHTAASGRCLAKTGTLDYVSNLAGYCHSRDGHTLAFALFVDGPNNSRAFVLIGKMVAAIARY